MTGQAVVRSNEVAVTLNVMIEDYMLFYGLIPDASNCLSRVDVVNAISRHRAMLLRDFSVRDAAGERMPGEIVSVEQGDLPAGGLEIGTLMRHEVAYHLRYPLAHAPTHVTFQQQLGGQEILLPATLDLEVRQEGLSTADRVELSNSGGGQTFAFDWSGQDVQPGETAEAAWQRRRAEQAKARMGITSYDAVYGFVYINDHEVRTEILVPLATLETWLEVGRTNRDFLDVAEQAAAREKLGAFFRDRNKVLIDGVEVKPVIVRLDFYGVNFTDFALRPQAERLSTLTARVGVILSYSTKGPPTRVDITWGYFNAAVYAVKSVVYAYNSTKAQAFSPYQPTYVWESPGRRELPKISALPADGAGHLDDAQAQAVAGTLLRNIYRAFDYRAESDIYDALARSVEGNLLADLYLKIHDSLAMQEQGGAVATVQAVEVTKATVTRRGGAKGFDIRLTWTVEGTVEHWGHIHTRVNEYAADFAVQPVSSAWKITGLQVNEQKRLRYQVRLRSF